MVDIIAANVLTPERILERKNKSATTTVKAICSFWSATDPVNVTVKYEPHLKRTMSFHESLAS